MKIILPLNHKEMLESMGSFAFNNKIPIWCVGGCVRDWFMGNRNKDLDLVCEKNPEPVVSFCIKKWGGQAKRFDEFGTFRVFLKNGLRLDFARARVESYRNPAALPGVKPGSLDEDLGRRDFTTNALAINIRPGAFGCVKDLFGGIDDIRRGKIRVLHRLSFKDDPTRLYRAARFAGRFGWKPDKETERLVLDAVKKGWPRLLSRERLKTELWRILEEKDPSKAFGVMKKWGLLEFLHPKLGWRNRALDARAGTNLPAQRLGVLASGMGKDGVPFLESLRLERTVFLQLKHVLSMMEGGFCSKGPGMSEFERAVLRASRPGLPGSAFKPLLIDGNDLKNAGIPPGREYSRILDRAAMAQWKGRFSSRKSALKWLRRSLLVCRRLK